MKIIKTILEAFNKVIESETIIFKNVVFVGFSVCRRLSQKRLNRFKKQRRERGAGAVKSI